MLISNIDMSMLQDDREALVRFCARYTGDRDAADDLAQQTLIQAWRHEQQLRDPQARRSWLLSIARTQCLMWARRRSRELARQVDQALAEDSAALAAHDHEPDQTIDRDELARFVDRALRLLPGDVRDLLIRRYIHDTPQAEVAARMGLSEGAVEARLHRGRRALRRVLTAELGDESIAYGLIDARDVGWEPTRVWCPSCGAEHLEGWLDPEQGKLFMRCPGCARADIHFIHANLGDGLRSIKTYRPAVSRVLDTIHDLFRVRGGGGFGPCPRCGTRLPLERGAPPWVPAQFAYPHSIYVWCPACGIGDSETWHSLTWSLPEARAFWRAHPRMRFVPARSIEFAGSAAVVTGFESLTGPARLDVVTLYDTLEVVSISGAVPEEQDEHD